MGEILQDVYETYSKDIYRYFYGLTLDSGLSEDLTADVFLEAVQSLHTFKSDASMKTWLFSIARHRWYHYLRKKKIQPPTVQDNLSFAVDLADETSMEKHISDRAMLQRIQEILQNQSEQTQSVIHLRTQGFSYYEIAAKLKISENSARVIEFRAKTKMKQILKKEGFLDESNNL